MRRKEWTRKQLGINSEECNAHLTKLKSHPGPIPAISQEVGAIVRKLLTSVGYTEAAMLRYTQCSSIYEIRSDLHRNLLSRSASTEIVCQLGLLLLFDIPILVSDLSTELEDVISTLKQVGVVIMSKGCYATTCHLYPFESLYFITDHRVNRGATDQVMWLTRETIELCDYIPQAITGKFLDIGCGCGFHGLLAASRGARVTCLDNNPRAISFTKANAALNGFSICVMQVAIESALLNSDYNLITFQPPYSPDHEYSPGSTYWSGGVRGDSVARSAVGMAKKLLSLDGKFILISVVGLFEGESLESHLRSWSSDTEIKLDILHQEHWDHYFDSILMFNGARGPSIIDAIREIGITNFQRCVVSYTRN